MPSSWLTGIQVGANLAGQRLDRDVRLQELRSQQAHRQFQERQEALQTSMLLEEANRKKQLFQAQIQDEADTAKAVIAMQAEMNPGSAVADLDPEFAEQLNERYGVPVETAALKHLLPVVARRGSQAVDKFMTTLAINKYKNQALEVREQIAEDNRLSREKMAADNLDLRQELFKLKTVADMDALKLKISSTEKLQGLRNEARKDIAGGQVSREQYLNRHMNDQVKLMAESTEARRGKWTPKEITAKVMKELGDLWDQEFESKRDASLSKLPKVGDVIKGYRFIGGWPPSDKRAWEKVP